MSEYIPTLHCDLIGDLGGNPDQLRLVSPPSTDVKKQWSTFMELMLFFERVKKSSSQSLQIIRLIYQYANSLQAQSNSILRTSASFRTLLAQKAFQFTQEVMENTKFSEIEKGFYFQSVLPVMNQIILS
jgi:hypothetical protein